MPCYNILWVLLEMQERMLKSDRLALSGFFFYLNQILSLLPSESSSVSIIVLVVVCVLNNNTSIHLYYSCFIVKQKKQCKCSPLKYLYTPLI